MATHILNLKLQLMLGALAGALGTVRICLRAVLCLSNLERKMF